MCATAQQECQEVPGDPHVTHRKPSSDCGGEERLPGAAQGVGSSCRSGMLLDKHSLHKSFCLGVFVSSLGKTNVDVGPDFSMEAIP